MVVVECKVVEGDEERVELSELSIVETSIRVYGRWDQLSK